MAGRIPNDHWTLGLDSLGLEETGRRLARLVLQCQPPYAIAVQGKWGSGKTSLMRYAMAALGGEPLAMTLKTSSEPRKELSEPLLSQWNAHVEKAPGFLEEILRAQHGEGWQDEHAKQIRVVPIWFNPWQHQHAELPLIALLQELRAQFTALTKVQGWATKTLRNSVEAGIGLLGTMGDLFLMAKGVPGAVGLGALPGQIREIGQRSEQRNFEGMENAQRLNLLFEEAVDRLLGSTESSAPGETELRRLVIFIDDLDRCSDAQTVRLLEAIKLYLQTPYCVFVIGMDGTAARRAVQRVLPHTGAEEAQEYLEKLFQARMHPQVPKGHDASFVQKLLEDCGLDDAACGLRDEDKAAAKGEGEGEGKGALSLAAQIANLIEPNPRKLKNFVGSLSIAWKIAYPTNLRQAEGATPPMDFREFLLAAYLSSYHPEVFRLLAYEPGQAKALHTLMNEGVSKLSPRPSPVELFLYQRFRHASKQAFPQMGDEDQLAAREPKRDEIDQVAQELTERLDRRRGDEAFIELWQTIFGNSQAEDVIQAFTIALQVASNVQPTEASEASEEPADG